MSDKTPLAATLAKIGQEIGYIQKEGYNEAQKYKFVSESDVVAKLRPALAQAGIMVVPSHELISVVPFVTSKGSNQFLTTIKSTFTFTDGEQFLTVTTVGQGADTGDKGVYKAMTGAKKYALLQAFLLATGDDPEITTEDERPTATTRNKTQELVEKPEPQKVKQAAGTDKLSETQKRRIFQLRDELKMDNKALGKLRLDLTGKHSSAQMTQDDGTKLIEAMKTLIAAVDTSGGELVA